tara:strand:+ start:194 stop:694 length:501 start_codon:yes stop_codon:yes gene_type:complete
MSSLPHDFLTEDIDCFVLNDLLDDRMVCVVCLKNVNISDELFAKVLRFLKKFIKYISTNNKHFNFLFNTHMCETLPASRIYQLQQFTYTEHQEVITKFLCSSCIVIKNKAIKLILDFAFKFWVPIKPVELIIHDRVDFDLNNYGIPKYTMDLAKKFFDCSRKGNYF